MGVLGSDSPSRVWDADRTAPFADGVTQSVGGEIKSLTILMPIFDDWACAARLLPLIDAELSGTAAEVHVILIDDGSNTPASEDLVQAPLQSISEVRVLRLRGNLGHQRAIAIGLYYVNQFLPTDAIVVMDGDGEDQPRDIPALLASLARSGGREMIFAARTKRLERPAFRFFYHLYRILHRVLTGIPVRVGNFSAVPHASVERLMVSSDLWNHYAAAAFRSKLPLRMVPLERGRRLDGKSRMNFFALVVHGWSAISVFADVVSVRLLAGATAFALFSLLLLAGVVSARFAIPHAMPAWVAITAGSLAVICLEAMMLSLVLVLAVISARSNTSFIPLRDSEYYILEQKRLWGKHEPDGLRRRRTGAV
jgi:glycosyltransferase involved in cell wall biosynthesis